MPFRNQTAHYSLSGSDDRTFRHKSKDVVQVLTGSTPGVTTEKNCTQRHTGPDDVHTGHTPYHELTMFHPPTQVLVYVTLKNLDRDVSVQARDVYRTKSAVTDTQVERYEKNCYCSIQYLHCNSDSFQRVFVYTDPRLPDLCVEDGNRFFIGDATPEMCLSEPWRIVSLCSPYRDFCTMITFQSLARCMKQISLCGSEQPFEHCTFETGTQKNICFKLKHVPRHCALRHLTRVRQYLGKGKKDTHEEKLSALRLN